MNLFSEPLFFILFVPLSLAIGWYFIRGRKSNATFQVSSRQWWKAVQPGLRSYLSSLPFYLFCLSLAVVILALARPQEANTRLKRSVEGIDIIITFDISDSMLIEDMEPENRLEAAKATIEEFIGKRVSDRIGLVVFSGEAYTRVPLTLDYKLLLESVKTTETSRAIKMGTALGVALANAVARLKDSTAKSKVVIFLTDGENNSGTIDPMTALEIAKEYNVKIYSIGMGRDGDAQLPVIVQDFRGRKIKQYRPIHSKVNDELLGRMAQETGGKYWRATDGRALERVFSEINQLERSKIDVSQYTRYREVFQDFLIWAVFIYIFSFGLSQTWLKKGP